MCTFGAAPSVFSATPKTVKTNMMDAGNILDFMPMENIKPFGMCTSPSNPTVAAATAAALGVLTPQPCIPDIITPWTPGAPGVNATGAPALDDTSELICMWGGVIKVDFPGQETHSVP